MAKDFFLDIDGKVFKIAYRLENHRIWIQDPQEKSHVFVSLELQPISKGIYLAVYHQTPFIFSFQNERGLILLHTPKATFRVRVRRFQTQENHQRNANHVIVRAPMSGTVIQLKRETGERVMEGEGVLILEAMKMQNEIQAPMDGIVKKIHVKSGQAVTHGMPLFEIIRDRNT